MRDEIEGFVLGWNGNPKRLKAIQTESEKIISELFTMRRFFRGDFRERTQRTLELAIDTWLTVNGYEYRLPEAD